MQYYLIREWKSKIIIIIIIIIKSMVNSWSNNICYTKHFPTSPHKSISEICSRLCAPLSLTF
ncbi:MAG: hypothetical protein N7Q72_02170 [Spiroplasma sp. Tabriz.8]|nr:hypothetical protein [Spiroplasma sp. Tabriz.8]